MNLVKPNILYKKSFLEAVKEYQAEKQDDRLHWYDFNHDALNKNFKHYLQTVEDKSLGKNLAANYVRQTEYWLIDNDTYIGSVSIRHRLNQHLLKVGGHIGFDIRPSKRKQNYGKHILQLALPQAKELGIEKVLVTCSETNIGSKKIIEANGGIFENAVSDGYEKPKKLRYWIPIR